MRRFILISALFLAAAGMAVAQGFRIPNGMLPDQITGKTLLDAVEVTATTSMSVGGFPVATTGAIPTNYVTTDTTQDIGGQKTFEADTFFEGEVDVTISATQYLLVDDSDGAQFPQGLRVTDIDGISGSALTLVPESGEILQLCDDDGNSRVTLSGPTDDMIVDGPISVRDSGGTTQIRVGSLPSFPNGIEFPSSLSHQTLITDWETSSYHYVLRMGMTNDGIYRSGVNNLELRVGGSGIGLTNTAIYLGRLVRLGDDIQGGNFNDPSIRPFTGRTLSLNDSNDIAQISLTSGLPLINNGLLIDYLEISDDTKDLEMMVAGTGSSMGFYGYTTDAVDLWWFEVGGGHFYSSLEAEDEFNAYGDAFFWSTTEFDFPVYFGNDVYLGDSTATHTVELRGNLHPYSNATPALAGSLVLDSNWNWGVGNCRLFDLSGAAGTPDSSDYVFYNLSWWLRATGEFLFPYGTITNSSQANALNINHTYNGALLATGLNVSMYPSSKANGSAAFRLNEGGVLASSGNYYSAVITRSHTQGAFTNTGPMLALIDSPVTNDGCSTVRAKWSNGLFSGGKIFYEFDPSTASLDANDFAIKHTARSDFYVDLGGNIELPGDGTFAGSVFVDEVVDSAGTGPTSLTYGALHPGHDTYSANASPGTTVDHLYIDASGGNVTITLTVIDGGCWWIKNTTSPGSNTVTIQGATGNIDGSASYTGLDQQYEAVKVHCDGANFWIF